MTGKGVAMIKTQRARDTLHRMWCPAGRVSLQTFEGMTPKVLPAGAFNRTIVAGKNGARDVEYLSSTCRGEACPLYRPGLRPWHWGQCGLAMPNDAPWISVSLIVSTAIVAVTVYALWGGA